MPRVCNALSCCKLTSLLYHSLELIRYLLLAHCYHLPRYARPPHLCNYAVGLPPLAHRGHCSLHRQGATYPLETKRRLGLASLRVLEHRG